MIVLVNEVSRVVYAVDGDIGRHIEKRHRGRALRAERGVGRIA